MSVQDVASNFSWKWYLKDLKDIPKKNIKVFSCFSCGGGSSMGYKRNGFDVIGCCEIDPRIAEIYKKNLNPKYLFVEDIRKFNQTKNEDLPKELFNLDILDGSPPCSTFSLAGLREDAWGKQKKFREGQELQTLDDLCFEFIKTAKKLKPKIVILENVKGLIIGNAKKYSTEIIKQLKNIGYEVQVFLLNSKYMDVPQARERVFFIANNQKYPKLKLNFNNKQIPYREIRQEPTKPSKNTKTYMLLSRAEKGAGESYQKLYGRKSSYSYRFADFNKPLPTIVASMHTQDPKTLSYLSFNTVRNGSSFPQDYDFGDQSPYFVCGMSVPPNMLANISKEIYKQWLEGWFMVANKQNLRVPTSEQARENGRKGGIASAKAKQEAKLIKNIITGILNCELDNEEYIQSQLEKYPELKREQITQGYQFVQDMVEILRRRKRKKEINEDGKEETTIVPYYNVANRIKAFETIINYGGQKPVEKQEIINLDQDGYRQVLMGDEDIFAGDYGSADESDEEEEDKKE